MADSDQIGNHWRAELGISSAVFKGRFFYNLTKKTSVLKAPTGWSGSGSPFWTHRSTPPQLPSKSSLHPVASTRRGYPTRKHQPPPGGFAQPPPMRRGMRKGMGAMGPASGPASGLWPGHGGLPLSLPRAPRQAEARGAVPPPNPRLHRCRPPSLSRQQKGGV